MIESANNVRQENEQEWKDVYASLSFLEDGVTAIDINRKIAQIIIHKLTFDLRHDLNVSA